MGYSMRHARIGLLSAMIGNIVEWYDFALYTAATPLVFASLFFSSNISAFQNQIEAIGLFASGFIARPLGGIFFGALGDRHGHMVALRWTLFLIGGATTLIGLLPTYAMVGSLAPMLLLLLRLVQGAAAGGEWAGSILVVGGMLPDGPRKMVALALSQSGVAIGMVLGTAALWLVSHLSPADFLVWGWRVPFLATLPTVVLGVWLRSAMTDLKTTSSAKHMPRFPVWAIMRDYPIPLVRGIGLRLAENGGVYLITVFGLAYGHEKHVPDTLLLLALMIGLLADGISMPVAAWLAARWGAGRTYLSGILALALLIGPFFKLIEAGSTIAVISAFVLLLALGHAPTIAVEPFLLERLFPREVQYSGVALGHEVGAILAGGLSPLVAVFLYHAVGSVQAVTVYAFGLVICSAAALFFPCSLSRKSLSAASEMG